MSTTPTQNQPDPRAQSAGDVLRSAISLLEYNESVAKSVGQQLRSAVAALELASIASSAPADPQAIADAEKPARILPSHDAMCIAEAHGGCYTAFDVYGCAMAIQDLVDGEVRAAKATIARLAGERDAWKKSSNLQSATLHEVGDALAGRKNNGYIGSDVIALALSVKAQLATAQAELAALREDKERVDWLSDNPIHEWGFAQMPGCITFNGEVYTSVRAAIDAARRATNEGGSQP